MCQRNAKGENMTYRSLTFETCSTKGVNDVTARILGWWQPIRHSDVVQYGSFHVPARVKPTVGPCARGLVPMMVCLPHIQYEWLGKGSKPRYGFLVPMMVRLSHSQYEWLGRQASSIQSLGVPCPCSCKAIGWRQRNVSSFELYNKNTVPERLHRLE